MLDKHALVNPLPKNKNIILSTLMQNILRKIKKFNLSHTLTQTKKSFRNHCNVKKITKKNNAQLADT